MITPEELLALGTLFDHDPWIKLGPLDLTS